MDKKYFLPLQEEDDSDTKNKKFQCLLCQPKNNVISSSVSSNSNLIKHIERVHPSETNSFKQHLEENKLKRKDDAKE